MPFSKNVPTLAKLDKNFIDTFFGFGSLAEVRSGRDSLNP